MRAARPVLLLALLAVPLAAPATEVSYGLVNQSDLTVMELYTSPAGALTWGGDLLGAGVIGPGETGTVVIDDQGDLCAYDLRMVFDDGQERLGTADVCQTASFTIAP